MLKIVLIFLFSWGAQAQTLHVGIADAFFCADLKAKNVTITTLDMTGEKDPYGEKCTKERIHHGDKVARAFLEHYKGSAPLHLHLYKVFKKNGSQDPQALIKTLEDMKKNVAVAVMAIGFFDQASFPRSLSFPLLAASGAAGNGIKSTDSLWPQKLEIPNLVLFAHFFPSLTGAKKGPKDSLEGHIDPSLMYLDKVDLLIPSPPNDAQLSGSSYAVAVGAARLLTHCSPLKIKDCLASRLSPIFIKNSPISKNFNILK